MSSLHPRLRRPRARLYSSISLLALVGAAAAAPAFAAVQVAPNYVDRPAGVVTADALPTTQIDGIAWDQLIVGNTVYVGGAFANARPAGAAAGTNLTPRANLLAYDLTTGVLRPDFAPAVNGAVKVLALSPDKSTLYLGGTFTEVAGQPRKNIAAINLADGSVVANFHPAANQEVDSIAVSDSAVYFGGSFTQVDGVARTRLAATTADGQLLAWAPTADLYVKAMTFTPDGSRLAIGGQFSNVNGTFSPGLAFLSPADGTLYPFAANQVVQNRGTNAGIYSLKNDGKNLLATGWWYGGTGNFEGVLSADPSTGAIRWMADCHGDSYDATTIGDYTYSVSHHHTCSNIGSFPEQNPRRLERAQAFTDKATTTVRHNDAGGYFDFAGQPAPTQVDWAPDLDAGTVSGASQAAWTAESNDTYLVLGGEFPRVNGAGQQGLVRFALPGTAPGKSGPKFTGTNWAPSATVVGTSIKLSWPANVDRDNMSLTYRLYRSDRPTTPLTTLSEQSQWFNRPQLGYLDQNLTAGTSYTYWVTANDPDGNTASSQKVSAVAGATGVPVNDYTRAVAADGATHYWRLLEGPGSRQSVDWASGNDLALGTGVTLGQPGVNDGDGSAAFDGTDNGRAWADNAEAAPASFSAELWFHSTSTTGGKLLGFGNQQSADSASYDRQVYLDDAGHLNFGVWPGAARVISSPASYTDGQWHHVVATLDGTGQALWVDGRQVASDPTVTSAQSDFIGYWRVGGDAISGWPGSPTSKDAAATIDDVAIYPTALTRDQVRAHYTATGRAVQLPARPTDPYGLSVYGNDPTLYLRLDETSGTVAADSSPNAVDGVYQGGPQLGVSSPVTGAQGVGARFASGQVVSGAPVSNPTTFSQEAWFNTTTTDGGQLVGLGNAKEGYSTQHDRQLWMRPDGRLSFGTWSNGQHVITTTQPFNDGAWHHVVSTLGPDGMALYVDGVRVATDPNTAAEDYVGYWHVGADTTWDGPRQFDGILDEVAVYGSALNLEQVRAHYRASAAGHDQAPTASFSQTCDAGACSFDASDSADVDGAVGSWSWDFGDGTTATGVTAKHTYAKSGSYTVKLTVTDDQGVATSTSHVVQVTVASQPPTAAFTSDCQVLACSFDPSGSTATAATITGWQWDFGDGATATEQSPSHTYAKAGSYTVKLTVTDSNGLQDSVTRTVTVRTAPTAAFTATMADLTASVDATASQEQGSPIAGYAWDFGDGSTGTGVTASHSYAKAGSYTIKLTVTDESGATSSTTRTVVATAPVNQPPTAAFDATVTASTVAVDATASADSDGTVASYAWDFGDGTTGTGRTASHAYTSAGTYTVKLTVTDNAGATSSTTRSVTVPGAVANQAPTAVFTHTENGLTSTLDASRSTDADGSIASYAWNFGDSTTGAGRSVQHSYRSAGTYTVTLTVTDDAGARTSTSQKVTVKQGKPVKQKLAAAAFDSTGAGWGSAEVGGAWSYPQRQASFSRNGKQGLVTVARNTTQQAVLGQVSAQNTTVAADLTVNRTTSGNGVTSGLVQRWSSRGDYQMGLRWMPNGQVHLVAQRTVGSTTTVLKEVAVKGLTYKPGSVLHISFSANGNRTTRLSGSVWADGQQAPATAQLTVTDATTALQSPGGVGVQASTSGGPASQPAVVLGVDNLVVTEN